MTYRLYVIIYYCYKHNQLKLLTKQIAVYKR